MSEIATTKLSSKGQVVIPEEIRRRLGLEAGAQFVVIGDRDVVVLKAIHPPEMSQFNGLISQARRAARRAGLKRSAIKEAVKEAREAK
jgi:AbrB family looped-hinge helix DNA binding protein